MSNAAQLPRWDSDFLLTWKGNLFVSRLKQRPCWLLSSVTWALHWLWPRFLYLINSFKNISAETVTWNTTSYIIIFIKLRLFPIGKIKSLVHFHPHFTRFTFCIILEFWTFSKLSNSSWTPRDFLKNNWDCSKSI